MKPLLLLGGGGHAVVLLEALRRGGQTVAGVLTPDRAAWGTFLLGAPVLGDDDYLRQVSPQDYDVVVAVGSTGNNGARRRLGELAASLGFAAARVVHPSAVIARDVAPGPGVQVMAGAVIQPRCRLEEHCLVNTRAVAEHDCRLDAYSHLAPGAVLCGGVRLGAGAFVGAGAVVRQNIIVGTGAVVGAGAVVLRDVPAGVTVYGNPARPATAGKEGCP